MIWVYTVTESNELHARDASSLKELQNLNEEADWLWIDFMDPSDKEFEVIAGLLEKTEIVSDIKGQKIFSRPERVNDCILFSLPHTVFKDALNTFPIYVIIKNKTLLTVRNGYSSKAMKNALKTFEDCVGKICEGSVNSSFILNRLFHEISNENLDVVMALRERIDKIEEQALAIQRTRK